MRRISLVFLLLVTLTACKSSPSPVTTSPIPTSTESAVVTTTVTIKDNLICIEGSLDETWPIHAVIAEWNRNGAIRLGYKIKDCAGWVTLSEKKQKDWGLTNFSYFRQVETTLDPSVPVGYRHHVLCHELGHALGLPHNNDPQSCMNVDRFNPRPSVADLQAVASLAPWDWENSARRACSC